jgi:hypothetical protein
MRRLRPAITYVNVVGTLALFLTLSGGVVLAANKITSKQIGKGAVKNKNLAKNAVKAKNLAKKSVTSAKLAKGAVTNANIADGAVNFAKLATGTNVVASSSTATIPAGQGGPVAFNPPLSVTPVAGQPLTVHLEARGSLAPTGMGPCLVVPVPVVNGSPRLVGLLLVLAGGAPIPGFPNGAPVGDIEFPIGLGQPGVAQSISLFAIEEAGEGTCTPDSSFQVSAVVTQTK